MYYTKRTQRKQTLNLLVCGTSGTGKSSFINTLTGKRVLFENESTPAAEYASTLVLQPTVVEMDEPLSDGSKLVLTMVETEGFGAAMNHESDVEAVANFIENKFDEVLAEESRIRRNPRFKDDRIDACLYFIEPTGHGLRELDILTLKRLASVVNVVPVLSRADQLTATERLLNKRLVNEDLKMHDIQVFDFQFSDEAGEGIAASAGKNSTGKKPIDGYLDEEEVDDSETAALLAETVPFAVTASNEFDDQGECEFTRKLAFGTVELLNPKHSDFQLLRDALFDTFFMELKDRTHEVLYETYRTHRLDPQQNHRQSLLLPQELADHSAKLKQAQIEREQRILLEREQRVYAEIEAKRAMLLKREQELRELEAKMQHQQAQRSQQSFAEPFERSVDSSYDPSYNQSYNQSYNDQPYDPSYLDSYDNSEEQLETNGASNDQAQSQERRVRQKRSQKQLTEHTQQLHAELGNLEQEKLDIQNRRMSVHGNLNTHKD